jgi:hypothetical protein
MTHVPNRYLLAKPALKAVREFHKAGVRIEDTANDVFVRFSHANPIGEIENDAGAFSLSATPYESILGHSALLPSLHACAAW